MNAEFNWWLLIVGLVAGAGLVWFVLMDARRREVDIEVEERQREAAWLSATLADEGWDVPHEAAARLLELHRTYLEAPPPDVVVAGPPVTARADATPRDDDGPIAPSERAGEDGIGGGT